MLVIPVAGSSLMPACYIGGPACFPKLSYNQVDRCAESMAHNLTQVWHIPAHSSYVYVYNTTYCKAPAHLALLGSEYMSGMG